MRIGFLQSQQVLDMLRKGIETEHFRARVSWPQGFDNQPTVSVTMNHAVFQSNEWNEAEDVMKEALVAELDDLCREIHSLTFEIGSFSIDRDCYRNGRRPWHPYHKSCYDDICDKKGTCA